MSPHDAGPTREDLAALLEWYVAMGVDAAVDEVAHDRFAECAAEDAARDAVRETARNMPVDAANARPARSAPRLATGGPTGPQAAALAVDEAMRVAEEQAAACSSLEELRAAVEAFDGCGLKRTASRLVFADGNPQARLMLVGEAPGADEDRAGTPFVGKSGVLLDRMLASIGLDRTSVYIAYVVPWRPPGNRRATPQELAVCLPFVRRHIELVGPDLLVCIGQSAGQSLLNSRDGLNALRAKTHGLAVAGNAQAVKALVTFTPDYLLKSPSSKRLAWRDLLELKKALDALPPRG